jgi:hypothetical protein
MIIIGLTRTLHVESAEALQNLESECEGFAESWDDDGEADNAEACKRAAAWLATLREHPTPFAVHIPEGVRHTVLDAVANLGEHSTADGAAQPGATAFYDAIVSDANMARLSKATPLEDRSLGTREALVIAYNAMMAAGVDTGALLAVASMLAQHGCVDAVDLKPMCGARTDDLTSVCDVIMYG